MILVHRPVVHRLHHRSVGDDRGSSVYAMYVLFISVSPAVSCIYVCMCRCAPVVICVTEGEAIVKHC